MRRMPPQQIEENLAGLLDIVPDLTEDLLSAVDQPLKVRHALSAGTTRTTASGRTDSLTCVRVRALVWVGFSRSKNAA